MQQNNIGNGEMILWPEGAPGALGNDLDDQPSIKLFLSPPEIATTTSVILCPGGGYSDLSSEYEGNIPAKWLNSMGMAAFILNYRIAPRYCHPSPMLDAMRAVRTVRMHAKQWSLDPNKIGIWGFSAGGHLAATVGTHFDDGDTKADDPVERVGCRPDFQILSYPVITMDPAYAHMGSRINLIGENPDPALVEYLSLEKQVTPQTPPTFLFHTDEDASVPAENSVMFYMALRKAGVPAEMHIYKPGRHGLNLAQFDPVVDTWPELLKRWMRGL